LRNKRNAPAHLSPHVVPRAKDKNKLLLFVVDSRLATFDINVLMI
jgi:hypothetical protein